MDKSSKTIQPMAVRPECYACLERLAGLAVELATPDPAVRRRALKAAVRLLDREFGPEAIPAAIANRFLAVIHRLSGNPDPFAARKTAATAWAARMHQRLAPAYQDDLESLLRLAAAGNALDFFRGEAEVAREMLARVRPSGGHVRQGRAGRGLGPPPVQGARGPGPRRAHGHRPGERPRLPQRRQPASEPHGRGPVGEVPAAGLTTPARPGAVPSGHPIQ